eukprot:2433173-Heterocapsa_arctica.AAC.1
MAQLVNCAVELVEDPATHRVGQSQLHDIRCRPARCVSDSCRQAVADVELLEALGELLYVRQVWVEDVDEGQP